jgi:hypothetical protein
MRFAILTVTFIVLSATLFFAWQRRFEVVPGIPIARLQDIRQFNTFHPSAKWSGLANSPELRLKIGAVNQRMVERLALPYFSETEWVRIRFQLAAESLVPNSEKWEDGRGMIEWHSAKGIRPCLNDPFGSVRYNQNKQLEELILCPDQAPAIPVIRFENLGNSGEFVVKLLEVTALRETKYWKSFRWVIIAGWLGWTTYLIRGSWQGSLSRALGASGIWVLMGIYFVAPGPWQGARPMGKSFLIPEIGFAHANPLESEDNSSLACLNRTNLTQVPSVGKVPDRGDLILKVKHYAENIRPLLHGVLFLIPTLLTGLLVGSKPARSLAFIMAIGIEAIEVVYGFGFDTLDVVDLSSDILGIVIAIVCIRKIQEMGLNGLVKLCG